MRHFNEQIDLLINTKTNTTTVVKSMTKCQSPYVRDACGGIDYSSSSAFTKHQTLLWCVHIRPVPPFNICIRLVYSPQSDFIHWKWKHWYIIIQVPFQHACQPWKELPTIALAAFTQLYTLPALLNKRSWISFLPQLACMHYITVYTYLQ